MGSANTCIITRDVCCIHKSCSHNLFHIQSYTMRNGVLGVIGEVVRQVLNSPELDEQAKCTRDQLLDKLEVRIEDV